MEVQVAKGKSSREESYKLLREKALGIFKEYLSPSSPNLLNIDSGLIETLSIRLKSYSITPDQLWFDSMCKFVYEKMKNEEVFLNHFYQSSAYRKLLLELEFCSNQTDQSDDIAQTSHGNTDTGSAGSDSNSGDIQFDDDFEFDIDTSGGGSTSLNVTVVSSDTGGKSLPSDVLIGPTYDLCVLPILGISNPNKHLDVGMFKHSRSHSDCTGLTQSIPELNVALLKTPDNGSTNKRPQSAGKTATIPTKSTEISPSSQTAITPNDTYKYQQRLAAKIINTAINCDGQYAVYAIQVTVIEDYQEKSWHVYRRYSRFLDLKKSLVKRVGVD